MAVKTCLSHTDSPVESSVPLLGAAPSPAADQSQGCRWSGNSLKAVTIEQGLVAPLPTVLSHQVHSSNPPTHSASMCQALCLVLQELREGKHRPCLQGTLSQTEEIVWVTDAMVRVCRTLGEPRKRAPDKHWAGVGERSLRKSLLGLVWWCRQLYGGRAECRSISVCT